MQMFLLEMHTVLPQPVKRPVEKPSHGDVTISLLRKCSTIKPHQRVEGDKPPPPG